MKAPERSKFVLGFLVGYALGAAAPAVVAIPGTGLLIAGGAASALRLRRAQAVGGPGAPRHGWDVFLLTAAVVASCCLLQAWVLGWLPDLIPPR